MRNNKGITLIALVITIIVLLILAGVSIAMLSGDNSILTQAQNASTQNTLGIEKEEAMLDLNELIAQYYEDYYVSKTFTGTAFEYLATYYKSGTYYSVTDNGTYLTVETTSGAEGTVASTGKLTWSTQ